MEDPEFTFVGKRTFPTRRGGVHKPQMNSFDIESNLTVPIQVNHNKSPNSVSKMSLPQSSLQRTQPVHLLFYDITSWSPPQQLVSLSLAIFLCYILVGFTSEYVFNLPGFKYGWFMTMVHSMCYAFNALVERIYLANKSARNSAPITYFNSLDSLVPRDPLYIGPTPCQNPHSIQFYFPFHFHPVGKIRLSTMAFCLMFTRGCVNQALQTINYPTSVVFKSAKLIPVMIGSRLLLNKKIKKQEIVAVSIICIGLAGFSLAENTTSPKFSWIGISWMCIALICDSSISNIQEMFLKSPYSIPPIELVYYGNLFGTLFLLFYLITTAADTELLPGLYFALFKFPIFFPFVWLGNLTGYLGVKLIINLINAFDSLTAIMVTSIRKMITLTLSFLIFFPRPMTIHHFFSALMVFGGVIVHVLYKNSNNWMRVKEELFDGLSKVFPFLFPKSLVEF